MIELRALIANFIDEFCHRIGHEVHKNHLYSTREQQYLSLFGNNTAPQTSKEGITFYWIDHFLERCICFHSSSSPDN